MHTNLKRRLLSFASASAVMLMSGAAHAQSAVSQDVNNYNNVTNTSATPYSGLGSGPTIGNGGDPIDLGTSSSLSISATGAAGSVSVSATNTALPSPAYGFGVISQSVYNSGDITNGIVNGSALDPLTIALVGGNMGIGSSLSISATGAVGAVSVSSVNDGSGPSSVSLPYVGGVDQYTPYAGNSSFDAYAEFPGSLSGDGPYPDIVNTGDVKNAGEITGIGTIAEGTSASVSASGAVASNSTSVLTAAGTGLTPYVTTAYGANTGNIGQWSRNTGAIDNAGTISFTSGALSTGASASVSATGAVASNSASFVNSNYLNPNALNDLNMGAVEQGAFNTGLSTVDNTGTIDLNGAGLGRAASVSVSATGAVASTSISAVSDAGSGSVDVAIPNIGGQVTFPDGTWSYIGAAQYSANNSAVTNAGTIADGGDIGIGASAAVSASGAVTAFSIAANNVTLLGEQWDNTSGNIDGVTQKAFNDAAVTNSNGTITAGDVGTAGSASISATGSAASVSVSNVNASTAETSGDYNFAIDFTNWISQDSQNGLNASAPVTNSGVISLANGTGGTGSLGRGASVSVSATGAVASVSASAVADGSETAMLPRFSDIDQGWNNGGIYNDATISNTGKIENVGDLGVGASASVSASGAVASISLSGNNVDLLGSRTYELRQSVRNYGDVTNDATPGTGFGIQAGNLSTGASVSASASGAVASTSVSLVNASLSGLSFNDDIRQDSFNYASATTNDATIDLGNGTGGLGSLNRGASVSVSATGAVASYSVSAVSDSGQSVTYPDVAGGIYQSTRNESAVGNTGAITSVGNLAAGASAAISASGAVSSIGLSANNVVANGSDISSDWGYVSQSSTNIGAVSNNVAGGQLAVGSLGNGASASISASGAVSSMSTSLLDTVDVTGSYYASGVNQYAYNSAAVTNGSAGNPNTIDVGALSGTGASASVGASGAVASTSYSSTEGQDGNPSAFFGNVYQTASNADDGNANVTNVGAINIGGAGLSGVGSSASVSATGAVASFSVASIADSSTLGSTYVGSITQNANNNVGAAVTNTGTISFTAGAVSPTGVSGVSLAAGASASISATGAAASVSYRSVQ